VYCYLDDFAQWALRKRRKPVGGSGASAVPASKIDGLS
jgi:hypothetical protein